MRFIFSLLAILFLSPIMAQRKIIVFQTDFGLKDGAVAAMKGVAMNTSSTLQLFDLTHEIPPYNIWEAGYRLEQTAQYWPSGTVFVSVVDPGVGTARRSVVLETRSGHFFVGPDNGQFTLVAASLGIRGVYEIDETRNRRKQSGQSYTFHGRDVYAFTGARLAAGIINTRSVGRRLADSVITISYQKAAIQQNVLQGNIPVLDVQYGNVWTNIPVAFVNQLNIQAGDSLSVSIFHADRKIYEGVMPFVNTFGEVPEGNTLAYLNSLLQVSFAINMGDFAATHKVSSGPEWSVRIRKHE